MITMRDPRRENTFSNVKDCRIFLRIRPDHMMVVRPPAKGYTCWFKEKRKEGMLAWTVVALDRGAIPIRESVARGSPDFLLAEWRG
jgi:hypothetical protein